MAYTAGVQQLGVDAAAGGVNGLLSQLGSYVAAEFDRTLTPTGVDPRTYAVLMALATEDGQSQRQLSARLGIHRNAMVAVIDSLERQGLAERRSHPEDRRAFAVTLTAKARKLLPDLDARGRALEDDIASLYPSLPVLFRRGRESFLQDGHTEKLRIDGPVIPLQNRLLHDDRKSLERWLQSQSRYQVAEAEKLASRPWSELPRPRTLVSRMRPTIRRPMKIRCFWG